MKRMSSKSPQKSIPRPSVSVIHTQEWRRLITWFKLHTFWHAQSTLSTAWKLNKIPWFFWGKKSLSKIKAINRIYPLTCRIILCLKLKKKTCLRKTLKYYLPRCWISVSFLSNLMTNCYKHFFLSNIRTKSINISSFYPRLILFYWKHFNFFEKEMLSCDILTPVLTFNFCTSSEIGWHLLEFKIIFHRKLVVNFVKIGCKICIYIR